MAFKINVKNKEGGASSGGAAKILEDIRVFVALMAVACVGLIVLMVFGIRANNETRVEVDEAKVEYQKNQASIANLKALQSRSGEYEMQRDRLVAMIPQTLDEQQIMIEMEERCAGQNCALMDISFGSNGGAASGTAAAGAAAAPTGLVNQMQVTLSVRGDYKSIMTLAKELVTDEELMRVDGIHITPLTDDGMKEAQITLMKFSKQ